MRYFFFLAVNLLFISHSFCQKWEWAKSYGDKVDQGGECIAVDKNNNIYVAGYTRFSTGGGPNPYAYWKQLLSKYDASGNLLWVDTVPAFIHARVRLDSEGNAYLFNDPMYNNGKIAKYDSNGNLLWVEQIIWRVICDVSIASNGDLIVAGYNNLGSDEHLGSYLIPNNYGFIAKADKDLNWKWVQLEQFFGVNALTVSKSNKIYAVGGCYGCSDSSAVRIYDFNGNCIKKVVQSNMYITLITTDSADNFYLAGTYGSSRPIGRPNQTIANDTLQTDNSSSGFVYKFDKDGVVLWGNLIGQIVDVNVILTDKDNSVYITGNIMKTFEFESFLLDKYHAAFYVMKLDSDGKLVWVKNSEKRIPPNTTYSNSSSGVNNMALNSAGDPIITGAMRGKVAFGEHELLANAGQWKDLLIAKIYQEPVDISENPVDEFHEFAIYPNPSGGIFNLQYHGKSSAITVTVRNQLGQLILSKNYGTRGILNETINLSAYSEGLYFVEFATSEIKEVRKVIIE